MARINSPAKLDEFIKGVIDGRSEGRTCVTLCSGSACHATGSEAVARKIAEQLEEQELAGSVDFRRTGCHGFCEKGPIVVIDPEEVCYLQVQPDDVPEIIETSIRGEEIIDRLLYVDPVSGEKTSHESDIPFYKHQRRMVFGPNRKIDPTSIEDYVAIGGYRALPKALGDMSPEAVIEEVKAANLRGRGGGGFPAGIKWEFARKAEGEPKYVVVNCDEGDPGAYMDRSLMEGNPYCVLEGLAIGAYAIGAHEGYFYVRQEYPLALKNLEIAIARAKELGLLGENILGTGFDFHVRVHRGAGAFVCGEETALLKSLEGRVGEPRPRPPYPAVKGLWDRPTNINNVETWANIPLIINEGAKAFASIGTDSSKGTKIFSLVGKISNTGLVEVPMGITLRDVIYKIGGGIPGGKKFKAVQTGGPSGGCIPENLLDLEVDFNKLTEAGSMMGSGGMIVMDEETCMVDVARYFIDFLADESCGKCVPCREGLRQMQGILTRITMGEGVPEDIEKLEALAEAAQGASLCALGKTAANPFLSTFRYFREEYEAHIEEKRCPALSCKALISYYIDPEKCQACMRCMKKCPSDAIIGAKKTIHIIDQEKCTKCGECLDACPTKFGAVTKLSGVPVPPPLPEDKRAFVRKSKAK